MALVVKYPPPNAGDIRRLDPWIGTIPWRRDPRSSWEMESKLSQSVKSRVTLRLHSPAGSVCNVHYGAASRRAEAED